MRTDPRQVLLNALAGTAARDLLRRVRGLLREADRKAAVSLLLEHFRVRRALIGEDRIRGRELLEIGSGRDFGLALLLVALGARRVVNVEVDPFGFVFDAAFYRLVVERARAEGFALGWPPDGLRLLAGGREARPDGVATAVHLGRSAAAVPEPAASFDGTFSVSVLQHVRRKELPAVARELYRVTRPGGWGHHRIDLTGMDRSQPFRHLCYDERAYSAMYENRDTYTNRYRMDDLDRIFRAAGFEEVRFEDVRQHRDRAEFEAVRPAFAAEFAGRDPDLLSARGCVLVLTRAAPRASGSRAGPPVTS